jgi:hypothetical protein
VTLTSLTRAPALPSAEDFVVIEEFLICFECIENMTEKISGEKYVTESLIIPVIRGIHLKLNDIETKRLMNTDIGKLMFQTKNESNSLLGFLDDVKTVQTSMPTTSSAIIEMRQYMETPIIKRHEDPLEYWEEHKLQFPNLHKLSQKFLGNPASSLPSERIFSATGLVLTQQRNRLKLKHIEKLIFVKQMVNGHV